MEELNMETFEEMVTDTEHIQEEFEDLFTPREVNTMDHDELAFAWFSSHDTDSDDALDGLELFKAVLHARGAGAADKAGYADELRGGSSEPHVSEEAMRDVEGFIDGLLEHYDADRDGLLHFPEFMISFSDNQEKLKGNE